MPLNREFTQPETIPFNCRLKEELKGLHEKIQSEHFIMRTSVTQDDYRHYLIQLYGFYKPIEARLSDAKEQFNRHQINIDERNKSALLLRDLLNLGVKPKTVQICQELPPLNSFAQCVGCLYVLEGATFGAQIISKHLRAHISYEIQKNSFSYLKAYSSNTLLMWDKYISFLNNYAERHLSEQNDILLASASTFKNISLWIGLIG